MKQFLSLFLLSFSLLAQQGPGQRVNLYEGPGDALVTQLLFRASGVDYICYANRQQATHTWTQSSKAITDITDAANTSTVTFGAAHGLAVGNLIVVSGVTTDTDLNGSFVVQSVPASTTLTITTASVDDAAYSDATQQITSTAPRDTAAIWTIRRLSYTGSELDRVQWSNPNSICANRATSTGATKVAYH